MSSFTESVVEHAALAWLESTGWAVRNGAEIAPGEPAAERDEYGQVVLAQRLRDALARLNPALPAEALDDAFRKLTRPEGAELVARSRALHRLLVDGVTVEYRASDGGIRGAQARVIDFDDPAGNDWLAVNQFSVVENKHARRPDVVLFVNGLPLAVVELKNAADGARRSGAPGSSCRPTRRRSRRCSPPTRCSPSPTGWKRGWARSPPGASGSSPGAPSLARGWPIRTCRSCRW